jgi:hypothetical protein
MAASGVLGLTPDGSTNCFSFWEYSGFNVAENGFYRARFTVGSTVSNPDDAVSFRLRATRVRGYLSLSTPVNSYAGVGPSAGNSKDYDVFIAPTGFAESIKDITGPEMGLAFDITSFDMTDDCECYMFLDEVVVQQVGWSNPLLVNNWTFDSGAEGWEFQGAIPGFDTAGYASDCGMLTLNPLGSSNCFSYWKSPDITVEQGKVYECVFLMKGSEISSTDTVGLRMRVNQLSNWLAWETSVPSGSYSPVAGYLKLYRLLFAPRMTTPTDTIQIAFDILSFDPNANCNSSLYLHHAELKSWDVSP